MDLAVGGSRLANMQSNEETTRFIYLEQRYLPYPNSIYITFGGGIVPDPAGPQHQETLLLSPESSSFSPFRELRPFQIQIQAFRTLPKVLSTAPLFVVDTQVRS